jgi:mannosyltransferase
MAAGVAPIATKVGAFPELIEPGKTGQLVSPNDPGDLAVAIIATLRDPAARKSMGDAAKQFVQRIFTWSAAGDSLLSLYANAIEHRKLSMRIGK